MAVAAKEAFWKEHQDSLVRIRSQLSSHGKNTPANRMSPQTRGRKSQSNHPPLGKYRRTPPPYLPRVDSPNDGGHRTPPLRGNAQDRVPPVRPKPAFTRSKPDYDSWGEESDDDDDDNNYDGKGGRYKPKPYPQPSPLMMGGPFSMFYPPPPKGANRNKRRKGGASRNYKDLYRDRLAYQSVQEAPPPPRKSRKKRGRERGAQSMPMFMPMPMMPMMMPFDGKYKYIYGESDSSEDEMDPRSHLKRHPLFAEDLVEDLISQLLEEELIPDVLMEALSDYDRWSYDHPAYLPTLYCCEDVMSDGIKEMVEDILREVSTELAEEYLEGKRPNSDPLEDFLSSLLGDAVDWGVREVVRECVLDLAGEHMADQTANGIFNDIYREELKRVIPSVLEDIQVDLIAEEFIDREVVATEVEEEAAAIATEVLHLYDNKISKREMKEVSKKAGRQLADSLLMDYMLSVIAHNGKIWAQQDYFERYLDDLVLALSMEQYYGVQKERDKTLDNKPLKKLHEKAFTEVALDVCLQQLTSSLDEDLADVDEYERGVIDENGHPISLMQSSS